MSKNYYLTTTIPYVNADPHIGFALEIVQADAIARYKKALGYNVFFNFGTDEHGQKIYQKAKEQGLSPKIYCDNYALKFDALKRALNLSYNNFIRTTDEKHVFAAQEFWKRCLDNGDIYKKKYTGKYCVGCELEKTDSELVDGKCPLHPKDDIQEISEENYFFKFSKYQKYLTNLYENPDFIVPETKAKEIQTFVKSGIKDFSISRLKSKMPWGIDVSGDPNHVMYVWFDALVNYISAIGWPKETKTFNKWWPVVQFAGKDNLRQQTAIWQAMLFSAGLSPSKQIFIHGFITIDGQKISKSIGNTINPIDLSEKYGVDAVRYFLLAKIHPYEDSDFSYEKFENAINSDLANGIGNLVSRIAKLCEREKVILPKLEKLSFDKNVSKYLEVFQFNNAIKEIFEKYVTPLDQEINTFEPWNKKGKKLAEFLIASSQKIVGIAFNLSPFIPQSSDAILKQFGGGAVKSSDPLFPRVK